MNDFSTPLEGIPILNIDAAGNLPPSRIKDAEALRSIHRIFVDNDNINAKNRAKTNDLLNGAPPYDQKEWHDAGMDGKTNINFGGAKEKLELQLNPFHDALSDDDDLFLVTTTFGEEEDREYYNAKMSEGITNMVRDWPAFLFNALSVTFKFRWDGLGVAYFPDMDDWRFKYAGMNEFFFPPQSFICEDELPIVTAWRSFSPIALWKNIRNEEVAAAQGWNIKATKLAIHKAASGRPKYQDWEYMMDQLKNNDLMVGATVPETRCIIGMWEEFDGTITYAICTEESLSSDNGITNEDFIYSRRVQCSSMQEGLIIFTAGLGTNRKTHGMRGMGMEIFAEEVLLNRLLGGFYDAAFRQGMFVLKETSSGAGEAFQLQPFADMAILPENLDVAQVPQLNLENGMMPAIRDIGYRQAKRYGNMAQQNSFAGAQRKTKAEAEAEIDQIQKVSSADMAFWYGPLQRLACQMVRRMIRKTYLPAEPGGKEIAKLKLWLHKNDVPLEAFHAIEWERTQVVRSIGAGSRVKKMHQLGLLDEIAPGMDDTGKQNLMRAKAVAAVGTSRADLFVKRGQSKRVHPDVQIANLENFVLLNGGDVPVVDGQNNGVHADVHVSALEELWKAYSQGGMPIEEYATKGRPLHNHAAEHVEKMSGDRMVESRAAMLRQALQQLGEDISNGLKAIQSAQLKAQKEAQEGGGQQQQQQQGPDIDQIAKFEMHRATMQFAQEKHELKMNQMMQTAHLKNTLADAAAAASIARSN
jgi:hypothetical protein